MANEDRIKEIAKMLADTEGSDEDDVDFILFRVRHHADGVNVDFSMFCDPARSDEVEQLAEDILDTAGSLARVSTRRTQ